MVNDVHFSGASGFTKKHAEIEERMLIRKRTASLANLVRQVARQRKSKNLQQTKDCFVEEE